MAIPFILLVAARVICVVLYDATTFTCTLFLWNSVPMLVGILMYIYIR